MEHIQEILQRHHVPILEFTKELKEVNRDYPNVLDLTDVILMGSRRGIDHNECRVIFENIKGN